ncbi:MAG: hypothetical protein U0531_09990 [Dehalococcoidia bacterium]
MLVAPDGVYDEAFIRDAEAAAEGVYVTYGGILPELLTSRRGMAATLRSIRPPAAGVRRVRLRGVPGGGDRDRWRGNRRTAPSATPSSPPATMTASWDAGASTPTVTPPSPR